MCHSNHGFHLLQSELAERGLEWEGSTYLPAPASAEPLTVEFDKGDLDKIHERLLEENYNRAIDAAPGLLVRRLMRGLHYKKIGKYAEALADLCEVLKGAPKSENPRILPRCSNELVRLYGTAPADLRDVKKAIALAEQAVKLQPGQWDYYNTLGIAYYRAGRYKDSLAALEKSLRGAAGHSDAFNLYFMAMSFHQLGQRAKAIESYSKAVAWHKAQNDLEEVPARELNMFRSEAAALLNLSE
jgi:tetratricopeptide (TPR) repeat protein